MNQLGGLKALITGGASGIGRATAELMLDCGADVAVLDRDIGGLDLPLRPYRADITDRSRVEEVVAAIAGDLGGIDILVNNAGIGAVGTVADHQDDDWHRVLDVNVVGLARVTAAALPRLRASTAAAIVNVCSIAALNGLPQRAIYSASKGAVLSLTFAMAADHVADGIRVNCVCPGTVATAWVDRLLQTATDPFAQRAKLEARQAIGRLVTPEEVARAIVYLASPASGSTTGTALDVDGGATRLRVRARGQPIHQMHSPDFGDLSA
jgi:NAD(P)-dependent dehydrogenase (short-subunit alcohol dehydrogenase family)